MQFFTKTLNKIRSIMFKPKLHYSKQFRSRCEKIINTKYFKTRTY